MPSAADYISPNPNISANPNPADIDMTQYADPSRRVARPASQVNGQPAETTTHPTLSQGASSPFPSNGGKQQ